MKHIYNVNEHYFDNINSDEKAYILGLFYSDGCIINDSLIFGQTACRKELVEKVNETLQSTYPISYDAKRNFYLFKIKNKILTDRLKELGCIEKKSLVLRFDTRIVPEQFMHSFIRGYFDGDGCIWEGKRKNVTVKDSSRKGGKRNRIIHNVKFTITGNTVFISELQNYLVKHLNFNKNKLNFSKAKTTKHICTLEYSGRKQILAFYNYIYKNCSIYEQNKKDKFEKIIRASIGKPIVETVLIEEKPEMVIVSQAKKLEGSQTIPEMEVESSDSKCTAPNVQSRV